MYVGRIVAIGRTKSGAAAALYRVSSRSFPNRMAVVREGGAAIIPKPGFESDIHKNPYIAYNCLKIAGDVAVATNGSQTDPIAEKIAAGTSIRDAMAISLLTLDYEKDSYNTPRIAAAIRLGAESGYLGVVRHDGVNVRELPLAPGEAFFVATYETNDVSTDHRSDFEAADAAAAARFMVSGGRFAELEKPVTAVAALETDGTFSIATFEFESSAS